MTFCWLFGHRWVMCKSDKAGYEKYCDICYKEEKGAPTT